MVKKIALIVSLFAMPTVFGMKSESTLQGMTFNELQRELSNVSTMSLTAPAKSRYRDLINRVINSGRYRGAGSGGPAMGGGSFGAPGAGGQSYYSQQQGLSPQDQTTFNQLLADANIVQQGGALSSEAINYIRNNRNEVWRIINTAAQEGRLHQGITPQAMFSVLENAAYASGGQVQQPPISSGPSYQGLAQNVFSSAQAEYTNAMNAIHQLNQALGNDKAAKQAFIQDVTTAMQ